jgi:DNA-binding NtrC family response regulator
MVDKKTQILIVDDDWPVCEVIKEALSDSGYDCVTAGNAQQALGHLAAGVFDAVLLDIKLPGISGVEILKKIIEEYPSTAVLMLTGIHDTDVAVETMKAGASDYLTKPFDLDRLDSALKTALEKKSQSKNTASEVASDPAVKAIEAIAMGVEARQEMLDVHSEIVIQRTLQIAREMHFSEDKIQKWISTRTSRSSSRARRVNGSIFKLTQNPPPPNSPQA